MCYCQVVFCNGFAKDARGLDDKRNAVQNPNSQGIKAGSGFRGGTDIPPVPPLFPIIGNLEIFCKETLKKKPFSAPPFMELLLLWNWGYGSPFRPAFYQTI